MSDIQQAREVLAKWREEAASQVPWKLDEDSGAVDINGVSIVGLVSREDAASAYLFPGDDRLIVGTAGNPELLDAIDKMLDDAQHYRPGNIWNPMMRHAERIAAAIIAADERMRS